MKIVEVVQAYHGSAIEPSRFRAAHGGSNSHTFGPYQSTRWGTFFTDNPEFARLYGTSREYRLNLQNTVDLDLYGGEILSKFSQTLDAHDPSQRDMWIAVTYNRKIWHMFEDEVGYAFTRFLRRLGYDSARFTEYNEDDDGNELMSHTIVVFNPTRIGR
jgi:hypothetical protein